MPIATAPEFAYRTCIRLVGWLAIALMPGLVSAQWQEGPSSSASSVAYTKDGKYLVEVGNSSFLVFTVATGAVKAIPFQNLVGFSNEIQYWSAPVTWAISPDSKTLAVADLDTGSNGEVIQFWDLDTGKETSTKSVKSSLTPQTLTYTPDGKTLILGSTSPYLPGTLTWINPTTGAIEKSIVVPGPNISGLTVSKNGLYLAGAESDSAGYSVYLWYVGSGKVVQSIPITGANGTPSLDFSPDSTTLAVATSSAVATWSVKTGKLAKQYQTNLTVGQLVRFSPDGSTLATLGDGFQVSIYKTATAANVSNLYSNQYDSTYSFAYSPNGASLAVCSGSTYENGTPIQLWNLTSKKIAKNLKGYLPVVWSNILYSADHLHLLGAVANSVNGMPAVQVEQWDPVTGALQSTYASDLALSISGITLSSDGKLLAAVGVKEVNSNITAGVDVWNTATNVKVKSLVFNSVQFGYAIAFTPDNKSLIVGGTSPTGLAIQQIEILTGKTLTSFTPAGSGTVSSIAISPSGTLATIGYGGKGGAIEVYNLATHNLVGTLPTASTSGVTSVVFSPDGKWIASAGAAPGSSGPPTEYVLGNIEIFDVATLQLIGAESHLGSQSQQFINQVPTMVQFSADSKTIYSNPVGVIGWSAPYFGSATTLSFQTGLKFSLSPTRTQLVISLQNGEIQTSALSTGN